MIVEEEMKVCEVLLRMILLRNVNHRLWADQSANALIFRGHLDHLDSLMAICTTHPRKEKQVWAFIGDSKKFDVVYIKGNTCH